MLWSVVLSLVESHTQKKTQLTRTTMADKTVARRDLDESATDLILI